MTEMERRDFGTRVAVLRKTNGWTAAELAERCGDTPSKAVIANLESGRKQPSLAEAVAIALQLEVPLMSLVVDVERPQEASAYAWSSDSGEKREIPNWDLTFILGSERFWRSDDDSYRPSRRHAGRLFRANQSYLNAYLAVKRGIDDVRRLASDAGDQDDFEARTELGIDVSRLRDASERVSELGITRASDESAVLAEAEKLAVAPPELPSGWNDDGGYGGERQEAP